MKNVLVVDDAAFMRLTIRMYLERNGYKVIGEASDGKDAIAKYRELKPDIVTMDITMPVLDGVQSLKSIMEIDPNSRVMMVSALGQENHVREAVKSGAKGFIVKPFKEEHFIKSLEML